MGVLQGGRPASAGPLFWPNMLSAVSLFAVSAASVVLTCDLIPSNHQKCRVLLIRLSLTSSWLVSSIDIVKV